MLWLENKEDKNLTQFVSAWSVSGASISTIFPETSSVISTIYNLI